MFKIKKGDHIINLSYGTNMMRTLYRFSVGFVDNYQARSIGPIAATYEYLVNDAIGLGGELSYSRTTIKYRLDDHSYNANFRVLRCMFRLNYHFVQIEELDLYFLGSAGFRKTYFDFESTNSAAVKKTPLFAKVPFGIKPGIGIRYLFFPFLGLAAELAAGTPLFSIGLTCRF